MISDMLVKDKSGEGPYPMTIDMLRSKAHPSMWGPTLDLPIARIFRLSPVPGLPFLLWSCLSSYYVILPSGIIGSQFSKGKGCKVSSMATSWWRKTNIFFLS